MCGIAGIFKFNGRLSRDDVEATLRMLDAQEHRGPDDWGVLLSESLFARDDVKSLFTTRVVEHVRTYQTSRPGPQVILGSRRLSIIDLSTRGRMPMSDAAGNTWVTHNGEIYNYRELREELQSADFSFRTQTDTESVINGYNKWGDDFLSHLRGMFAFALFDSRASRLVLARDRFGIKPLYYYQDANQLIFASEVRALARSGVVPIEREPEAAVRFLQLGSVPAPLTTIKNVLELPAGQVLCVGSGAAEPSRYWSLSDFQPPGVAQTSVCDDPNDTHHVSTDVSESETIATTRQLLDESVRQHLLSDVPLGVFLSGGLDSSALVSLAKPFRDQPLTTVSIVFGESEYDEREYSRLVAKTYQTSHCEIALDSKELVSQLPNIFAAMDQPTVDGVNSFFVSRAAKQAGLKVVLSGLGGDEVFLGYSHLRRARSLNGPLRLFGTLPVALRKGLIELAIPAGMAAGRRGLEKLAYLQDPSSRNMYLLFRGLFAPKQIQKLLGLSDAELKLYGVGNGVTRGGGWAGNKVSTTRGSGWVNEADSLIESFVREDFQHYLQNQLLKDTDCMSMAHSIETRVPFLDHKLVEYVMRQPLEMKLNGAMNKPLLVKAMGDDLPRAIWDRPKMGFTFPFEFWLRDSIAALQPNGSSSGIDKTEAEKVWNGFRERKFHWSRPWALLALDRFSHQKMSNV